MPACTGENGALVSDELPTMRLRPPPEFAYRGAFDLPIKDVALATRHHFAEERDGTPRALLPWRRRLRSGEVDVAVVVRSLSARRVDFPQGA